MPNVDDKALKFVWSVHAQRSQCSEILNVNFIILCVREGIGNSTASKEKKNLDCYYTNKFKVQMGGRSGAAAALVHQHCGPTSPAFFHPKETHTDAETVWC